MRVQAEPSEIIVNVEGLECRVWNGVTEAGEQVFLFVHRVAVANEARDALLEKLITAPPPRGAVAELEDDLDPNPPRLGTRV